MLVAESPIERIPFQKSNIYSTKKIRNTSPSSSGSSSPVFTKHVISANPTAKQLAAYAAYGSFSHQSLIRNGFATGPYFRYWQDLFDLRPSRLIFALTLVYEILGKEETPSFLMKYGDDKFDWIHPTMPLGSMYARAVGPPQPPSTVEMLYTCGAASWCNGDAAYLMKFTRNADVYAKELELEKKGENEVLDKTILIRAVNAILDN